VLDVERQLAKYGAALEESLLRAVPDHAFAAQRARATKVQRMRVVAAIAAVALVAVGLTWFGSDDRTDVATHGAASNRPGVLSHTTAALVVLVDERSVTGVDLDSRRAVRWRIPHGDGKRSVYATGYVVRGGSPVTAVAPDGGQRTLTPAGEVVAAAEQGEVWVLSAVRASGDFSVERIRVSGPSRAVASGELKGTAGRPVVGVPGGLLLDAPEGVSIWDPSAPSLDGSIGPGPVTAAAVGGHRVAWCRESCADVVVRELPKAASPVQGIGNGQPLAISGDGNQIAVLEPTADGAARLVVRSMSGGQSRTVSSTLSVGGSIGWSDDAQELMYVNAERDGIFVGTWRGAEERWEGTHVAIPARGQPLIVPRTGFALEIPRTTTRTCEGNSRDECIWAFASPDTPEECVVEGDQFLVVPDATGRPLVEAVIVMQQAGLTVVGSGVPSPDSTDSRSRVRAQAPPGGSRVPIGACVAFRTSPP